MRNMMNVMKPTLVVMLLLTGSVMYAQETAFGIKGGLNLSTINLDDAEASYDSRTGYHAGIFFRGKFDRIAIQPEVLFYTQNGEIASSTAGTAEESFTYLTVPVMLKFYPTSVLGLNLQAGPQFGFLLDGERTYESRLITIKEDIKDHYKSSDVSISAGAGYDFKFGLNIDFRYNIGIKDINNEADGEGAKSRVFMISLGWNFIK